MLITRAIIQAFLTNLFSSIYFEKNSHIIQTIFQYNFCNTRTICYIAYYRKIYHEFWIRDMIPLKVLSPEEKHANIRFCDGFIISAGNLTNFVEILSNFKFPPHKRVMLFLDEDYHPTFAIEAKVYKRALSLIVIHGQINSQDAPANIYFTIINKTKVLGKDKINQEDFSSRWTPKLWTKIGRNIRVSLFHCPPYVIVKDKGNYTRYSLEGIDFNIFRAITSRWPVEFLLEEEEENTRDNLFIKIIQRVVSKESDIAMCGLWQRVILERKIEMSKYNSVQCLTFLVAKPRLLGDETFIFQPFSDSLWLHILALLSVTSLVYIFLDNCYIRHRTSALMTGMFLIISRLIYEVSQMNFY